MTNLPTLEFKCKVPFGIDDLRWEYRGIPFRQHSKYEWEVWYQDNRRSSGHCILVFKTYSEVLASIDARFKQFPPEFPLE